MHITASAGFFGGYAIDIRIIKGKYKGTLSEYAQIPLFKQDIVEKKLDNEITVTSTQERLVLSELPKFRKGEALFGQYEATFKPYCESNGGIRLKRIKVKVIFKCELASY